MKKQMKTPAYTLTKSFASITFIEEGKNVIVKSTEPNYDRAVELIKEENWETLRNLLLPQYAVKIMSQGKIDIVNGGILYEGRYVHHVVVSKIMEAIEEKLPVKNLMAFLENILDCDEDSNVLNELFLFLESNESMPIMEDGSFLTYRVVDSEYMSKHPNPDGTRNRNMVGDIIYFDKANVDPVRSNTCSRGLHFCSLSYVPSYGWSGSDRVMIVKIFPQHVVSIPNDYNNAKGRCYQYEVVGEVADYGGEDFTDRAPKELEKTAYHQEDEDGGMPNECNERQDARRCEVTDYSVVKRKYSKDVFNKVAEIVAHQIVAHQNGMGITTARRVSNSTRNPYVPVADVISMVELEPDVDIDVDYDVDSLSKVVFR